MGSQRSVKRFPCIGKFRGLFVWTCRDAASVKAVFFSGWIKRRSFYLLVEAKMQEQLYDFVKGCSIEITPKIAGCHFYPLGGFEATAEWVRDIVQMQ